MITCEHCGSTFEQRRKDQRFCQRKCKEANKASRTKQQRLERDRKRLGVDPKRYRNLNDPASVAAKFGFEAQQVKELCRAAADKGFTEENREEWDF